MDATDADGLSPDSRGATVRHTATMTVGTLLSRVTGLLRLTLTLAALGLTVVSDSYNAANTTPNMLYELILGGILTSVLVPLFVERATHHDDMDEAASRLMTLVLAVLGALTVLGMVLAPWIMRLYMAGVDDPVRRAQSIQLGTVFLRWLLPQMIFYGITAVATGILTARRRFAPPMFAPILNNLAVIVTMLVFIASAGDVSDGRLTTAQTTLLGLGTTLGVVALAAALWPAVRSTGFRFRFRTDWRHDTVRSLLRLGRWVVVYVLVNQVAYVVIINMGQRLGEGVYTAYSQAFLFFSLPHAVIAVSIATALLPGMAERWQARSREGVSELFSRGLRDTWVVMLPAAAGLIALAGPIIRLFAEYGEIGAEQADLLTEALAAFAIGLPFFSAFQLLTKTFYATHDSRTPALVNLGAATVNLTANLLFAFAVGLGVSGLAFGHAASYAAGTAALLWLLRGRLGHLDGRRVAATAAKAAIAATASGLAAFATSKVVAEIAQVRQVEWRLVQVVASVIAGVLVFLGSALMFRIDEVDEVRKALRSRFRG